MACCDLLGGVGGAACNPSSSRPRITAEAIAVPPSRPGRSSPLRTTTEDRRPNAPPSWLLSTPIDVARARSCGPLQRKQSIRNGPDIDITSTSGGLSATLQPRRSEHRGNAKGETLRDAAHCLPSERPAKRACNGAMIAQDSAQGVQRGADEHTHTQTVIDKHHKGIIK